jgi:hypothetical protein
MADGVAAMGTQCRRHHKRPGTTWSRRPEAPGLNPGGQLGHGCARRLLGGATCIIYILNDNGLQAIRWDYEIVLRHERGYCNGWHHD